MQSLNRKLEGEVKALLGAVRSEKEGIERSYENTVQDLKVQCDSALQMNQKVSEGMALWAESGKTKDLDFNQEPPAAPAEQAGPATTAETAETRVPAEDTNTQALPAAGATASPRADEKEETAPAE